MNSPLHPICPKIQRKYTQRIDPLVKTSIAGLKPFICLHEGCTAAFKRKADYQRHQVVHSGEKNFLCLVCGIYFLNVRKIS